MTDKQQYREYLRIVKLAQGNLTRESVLFAKAFWDEYGTEKNTADFIRSFWIDYGFSDVMYKNTAASIISSSAIGFNKVPTKAFNLIIENSTEKAITEIYGKTNGEKLSAQIYRTDRDAQRAVYNELKIIDKNKAGFERTVKNVQKALGEDLLDKQNLSGYMRELESSAKKVLKFGNKEDIKTFNKAVKKARTNINKLTDNRVFQTQQKTALNQIIKGVEKQLPDLVAIGTQKAIAAKNKSIVDRLILSEDNRVFSQARFNERIEAGIYTVAVFNINPRHKIVDECDVIAAADQYGLGRGKFPIKYQLRSPIHPNWQGFWTYETKNQVSEERVKEAGVYKTDALAKEAEEKGLYKSQVKNLREKEPMSYQKIDSEKNIQFVIK